MRIFYRKRTDGRKYPAAFIDRDGTINRNRRGEYITSPDQLFLYKNAAEGLKLIAEKGFLLIIVSNHSGINRGYMSVRDASDINDALLKYLSEAGVSVDGVYICPHRPEEKCACRKPADGLIKEAAADFDIDMSRSFVAGDKVSDVKLALNTGVKGFMVLTGSGRADSAKGEFPTFRDLLSLARKLPSYSL